MPTTTRTRRSRRIRKTASGVIPSSATTPQVNVRKAPIQNLQDVAQNVERQKTGSVTLYTKDGTPVQVSRSRVAQLAEQQPGEGFAVKEGAAGDFPVLDPYQQYASASSDEAIWQALFTEAGRQAIGAQMAIPIRVQLDYQGVARKFFEIDVLAPGQIARYDLDIWGSAAVLSRKGETVEFIVEGEYIEPPTWEIFAPEAIRLNQVQQRRFNVLDRMQERISIHTQIEEDTQFLALLDASTLANSGATQNPITAGAAGASKQLFNTLAYEVQKWDLPAYAFLMHHNAYKDMREWARDDFDPVTMRQILETGLYGKLWGIDVIVSRLVATNTIYCMSEPRFFGVMPIRTDLIVMPDDEPKRALIAYVGYEEIGMAIGNANGLGKVTFSGSIA